jgi:hypothetical protein
MTMMLVYAKKEKREIFLHERACDIKDAEKFI